MERKNRGGRSVWFFSLSLCSPTLSYLLFVFSRCVQVTPPLGPSDMNGKCKHSDELPEKKEVARGAYLSFSKAFSTVFVILV